jgi:hypothetical protein
MSNCTTHSQENGNEAETVTEFLDAPSTPLPDVPSHVLTMDRSSHLKQQVDNVSCIHCFDPGSNILISCDRKVPDNIDIVHPLIKPEPLDDEVNLRPAKRTRYFLEAIELPTLASVLKRESSVVPTVVQGKFDESIGKFTNVRVFHSQMRNIAQCPPAQGQA